MRYLIVNADDFGQSDGVNRGIIECFERGVVTSASLMVRWPAAEAAASYAKKHPELSVGLHVDLGEWTNVAGSWEPIYEVVSIEDEIAVREEVERQLEMFEELLGGTPSHLDSHQHVHLREAARPVLRSLAVDLGVPLRHATPGIQYCGAFYAQSADGESTPEAVSPDAFIRLVGALDGFVTELVCHPAQTVDLDTMYRIEREWEVETLTDPGIRRALEERSIHLRSFNSIPRRNQSHSTIS